MSVSDPAPAPPPPDPPAVDGPRVRLGPVFWLMLGLGLACVLAGYLVATKGPQWFPARPAPAAGPPPAAAALGSVDARLAEIQAQLGPRPLEATPEPVVVASAEVAALADRLDRIERRQQGALDAAATALAVASLDQAARGSRPFSDQLATVERFLPAAADVRRLHVLADAGAPSRPVLAAEFPQVAARAVAARQAGISGEGWAARLARALAAVITVRRVDRTDGEGPDAVLARAEAHVNDGDLEAAVAELGQLPAPAQAATDPWRRRALRRIEIDRRLDAIRTAALQGLSSEQENLAAGRAPLEPRL